MSEKLDMALDDVVSTQRTARRGRGRGGRKVSSVTRTKVVAPVGGIQKNTKVVKTVTKVVPRGPAAATGSKIIVSNLPTDVTEKMVKDYFSETVGPVRRVTLTYGPNGIMTGVVTILFSNSNSANKALESLSGVKVDNRPMKIEVVLDASKAPAVVAPKGISDRITQGKGPKPATAAKPATNGTTNTTTRGGGRARGRGTKRGRNAGRGKPKTADELDAEMMDYFDTNAANGVVDGATAQPVANGGDDLGMDEIS